MIFIDERRGFLSPPCAAHDVLLAVVEDPDFGVEGWADALEHNASVGDRFLPGDKKSIACANLAGENSPIRIRPLYGRRDGYD